MKKFFLLLPCAFLHFTCYTQSAICLDMGQPIDGTSGQILMNYDAIASTCTPNVRLNFILGPWNSPDDITLHNGKTWAQTYNEIIDSLVQRGINVYGLIGAQISYNFIGDLLIAYPSAVPADSAQAAQWEQDYVYNFVSVVDKFKDRVRTFECYNEPNNWDNTWTSVVHPKWFALILQDIYLNVKYFNAHWGDSLWQVNLISGPILTHDLDNGAAYLNDTYWYGKNQWAWDWTMQQTGSYPLDGIAMHLYCEQGTSDSATTTNAMLGNINAMWNIITTWEGATNKQIWISEFGWESSTLTEQGQADNLRNGFTLLLNDARIGLATFFTIRDWPGAYWGMYYWGNFAPADRKLAYYEFLNVTNCITTSVSENQSAPFILYYDNSTGNYFLEYFLESAQVVKIELFNALGQKVLILKNETVPAGKQVQNISFENGLCLLKISTGEKTFAVKLLF